MTFGLARPQRLDRRSRVPLHHQLRLRLEEALAQGRWTPGARMPGDHELEAGYGVSRTTVRQALRALEIAGRLTRHRGRGTFVAAVRLPHGPEEQLADALCARGLRPGWRLLAAGEREAPADVAARLGLEPGAPVFESQRLRLAGDEPLGLLVARVPASLAAALPAGALLEGGSMDYLAATGRLEGARAERWIEAVAADAVHAAQLGVPAGSPLLQVRRRLTDAGGAPLEDFCGAYRGDRFHYHLTGKAQP